MLLICPVRPGDKNEELRYALRSWEANLVLPDGLQLMTVGHCPPWLEPDHHVIGNHYKSAPMAVFDNMLLGSEAAMRFVPKDALYMNDDFFCLDPVGAVLPVKRDISLAEHIAKFPLGASTWWPASLRLTASWLAEQGFPHPDSYEVHRPLLASPAAMYEALSRWDGGMSGVLPQWRTVYGTLNKVDAYPVSDAKLTSRVVGVGTPWVSTSDENWRRYAVQMQRRFQKPSRWEITQA
jgi:hypothetical protein